MILNRISGFVDDALIPEQAGFRPGKLCCGQVLNLTQYIEDGFEKELITGVAFIDLSAAYDTINHKRLSYKIY
jgi:Reverse transcriptase (RNA-dependent DNA polymerase).